MLAAFIAMSPAFDRSHLMLLAGMVMLGWILMRTSISRRKRLIREGREADRAVRSMQRPTNYSVPLSDAPAQTQRWQGAMFDLQRELKGELDSRIAIVQSLVQHADRRIAELRELQSVRRQPGDASSTNAEADPATTTEPHPGDGELLPGRTGADASAKWSVEELTRQGLSVDEISRRTGLVTTDIERIVARRSL